MSKQITFKNKVSFDRQETDHLLLPYSKYNPQRAVPAGVAEISDPKVGEIYYFVDEDFLRPAVLVYVGLRGDTLTANELDSTGDSGTTDQDTLVLTDIISSDLETAFGSTPEAYLHIYSGPNVGVYLIENVDAFNNQITVSSSSFDVGMGFDTDTNIEWSVRNTSVFTWIDLAKPEEYLGISELQPKIDLTNQIPIEYLSNLALSEVNLNNLAANNLADGSSPWTDNATNINLNSSSINDILTKVELRNLDVGINSLFSAAEISLTAAVEEIDNVALTTNRDIFVQDLNTNIGFLVNPNDIIAGEINDIFPALQIGGSRNATAGLRTGVIFTSEYNLTGAYPFIRSDRNPDTFGSAEEPDYSWYPYTRTGFYMPAEFQVNLSIDGKNTLEISNELAIAKVSLYQNDTTGLEDVLIKALELELNNEVTQINLSGDRNFELNFSNNSLLTKILEVEFDEVNNALQELQLFPWITLRNSENLTDTTLIRFDNNGNVPRMYFFNTNNDQIGGIMGDPTEPMVLDIISTKAMNFVAEDQYRARIDSFTENAVKSEELSSSGVTLYTNQNTAVLYSGEHYRDWIQYTESTAIDNIDIGDYIIIEESVNGVIKRHFYDSEVSGRFVHAIDQSTNRVFLKKYISGTEKQISTTITRVVLNKIVEVSGNSRFILTGMDEGNQFIELGGIRQIPFEDISIYSKTGRDIYISPSGDNLFKFTRTVDETGAYSLPLFEFTDENKIRMAALTTDVQGDMILSSYGNKAIFFAREAYMMLNRDNPVVTTLEIAGAKGEEEHNARISLHGSKGNLDMYSTSEEGFVRLRNALVLHNQIVDLTGAPAIPPTRLDVYPDPIITYPFPRDSFPTPVFPVLDDTERRFFERHRDSDRVNDIDDRLTFRF